MPEFASPNARDSMIENLTYDELVVGDGAHLFRTVTAEDLALFAAMSGDVSPSHVDAAFAADSVFHAVIVPGAWVAALISTVIGTACPGPGSVYLAQALRFLQPAHVGDQLEVRVTVSSKEDSNHHVTLDCACINQYGTVVVDGTARVLASIIKVRRPRIDTLQAVLHARPVGATSVRPPMARLWQAAEA